MTMNKNTNKKDLFYAKFWSRGVGCGGFSSYAFETDEDYEMAATDELALRAVDYSDDNMFALENQDLIDESRMDWIMNKE